MKSKVLFAVMLVVALALIATACAPAPAPTTAPAAPTAAVAKFSCTDKLGCIDVAPNDPVHIAYAFVTSGENSTLGLDTKYGAELAVDDKGGKVLGHAIKFDGQDSGCSAEGGQAAATKLAADKTIVAIIGTNCSSEARAAIPILMTQSGLSMISPSNTAVDLTDPAKHVAGYFRTAHNDKVQGAVAAEFAFKQLKVKSAATIHDGSIYAKGLADVFTENFKKLGGTVTAQEAVNVGDKDMKPVLTRIAAGKPDMIYFPIFIAEGGFIASQIRDVPGLEKTAMMGADGIFSPDFLKAGGKNVVGMFWSSPNFEAFGSGYQVLVDKYLKKYNVKGTLAPFHAHAYDGMNVVLAALEKTTVKDADGTLHVQKQALRDAIGATKDFKGITGNITCDPNGDCSDPKIALYQASAADFTAGTMPKSPVWFPGGPDYKAPAPSAATLPDLKGRALKVGSDTTYPPFEFVDKTNAIIGYDVDVVNAICGLVNCKATFVTTGFDTIIVALSQKQFDLVASGLTITDERKKAVDFGDAYLHYGEVIIVRADESRIKSKDDLKSGKYIVGVQTGTSNEETAKTLVPDEKKQLKRFDDFSQAVAALIGKDVDVVEIDKPAADGYMAQNAGKLKIAGDPFTSNDLALAFQKGDKTLQDAFNASLKKLQGDGTMDKIYKKWFVDYKP